MGVFWFGKKTGDFKNYYTKKETDTLFNNYYNKKDVDDKFTSFSTKYDNYLKEFKKEVDEELAHLNEDIVNLTIDKLDVNVYQKDKQTIDTSIKELNSQVQNINEKIVKLFFYKGEVKYFTSIEAKDEFVKVFNIQENVDYKLLDQQVIGVSPTGTPFGDSLIQMNQTPQLKWGAYVIGGGRDNPNEGFSNMFITQYNQWIIGPGGWGGANFRFQNYTGDQQPFTPRIDKPLIAIEFLRRIERSM